MHIPFELYRMFWSSSEKPEASAYLSSQAGIVAVSGADGRDERSSWALECACQLLQCCLPSLPLKDFLLHVIFYCIFLFSSIFVRNKDIGSLVTRLNSSSCQVSVLPEALGPEDAGAGTCQLAMSATKSEALQYC